MANKYRGEVDAELDGKTFRLCLTLGALAELEQAFGETDMLALASRFETGRIAAREVRSIIAAGLRGAGYDITDDDVGRMQTDRGAAASWTSSPGSWRPRSAATTRRRARQAPALSLARGDGSRLRPARPFTGSVLANDVVRT